ncbi:hypothetical protein BCR32DRAFT_216096, partial [Anaeromyces robustus]
MHFNSKTFLALLATIPASLAATNGRCTGKTGICISTGTCGDYNGSYVSGKCPNDPSDIKCCDDIPCKSDDGRTGSCECLPVGNCSSGNTVSGKCPGGSDIKCCLP